MTKEVALQELDLKERTPISTIARRDADTVEARRHAQFRLRMQGVPRKEIIKQLTTEFRVSFEVIDDDWKPKIRERWIARAAELTNVNSLLAEIRGTDAFAQQQFRNVVWELNKLIESHRNNGELDLSPDSPIPMLLSFKQSFLKSLRDGNKALVDNAIKIGVLKEIPQKILIDKREVSIQIDWNKALEGLDDEARRKVFDNITRQLDREDA